ncbi:hypothetical protein NDN01_03210 [Sphingomonas sp. QA11]|uniref:hypothetical protein n=1 Tax=Sphingomonas sp. QA11 TaxID=2950605 RepID=UPI00234B4AFF|nr:hypothetical protein [Sphingomonas sp. QA11]WCM27954.1 hypothetical protein NDN01_03210 [Sphingomonas sp. QA11]
MATIAITSNFMALSPGRFRGALLSLWQQSRELKNDKFLSITNPLPGAFSMIDTQRQLDSFKEVASDLETDDDSERFEKLAKVVKHKPVEKPE